MKFSFFKCQDCQKYVYNNCKFIRIHLNNMQKKNCSICHKSFKRKNISRHVQLHHNDNYKYLCLYKNCSKSFENKFNLNRHIKNIHQKNNKKYFKCHCNILYPKFKNLF